MPKVTSDAIRWIGHDGRGKILFVRFTDGDLYSYEGVPRRLYRQFLTAPSKGAFFQERVRDRFVYRKLHEPEAVDWDTWGPDLP